MFTECPLPARSWELYRVLSIEEADFELGNLTWDDSP